MQAFDSEKYLKIQSSEILKKISENNMKLYLEFGGKLLDDYHASRVLPGFLPDLKIKLLESLKDDIEVILTINTDNIINNKKREDYNITYDLELIRLINILNKKNILVNSIVITKYIDNVVVNKYIDKLKKLNLNVYKHYLIDNYPNDIDNILSSVGFGKNDYIPTTKKIIIVTAPGAGSGKLAVCMSQVYNDSVNNIKSIYAKFETFPVWNLSIDHPVNLAYEAATADINDINMIDEFYFKKYNKIVTNYNRDLQAFPLINKLLYNIYNKEIYSSPTEMGVNMVGFCFNDEEKIIKASKKEVIRRYNKAVEDYNNNKIDITVLNRIKIIVRSLK
ncbi:MAG: DUF1846 family protein [Clostridia bacterium]